jgi:hypothetical protein
MAAMTDGAAFDLVLLGYRNDLARERVLDYLAAVPPRFEGPPPIDRFTPVPQLLFKDLSRGEAEQIGDELRARGAQVRLVPPAGGAAVAAVASRPPRLRGLTFGLIALVLLAVVVQWTRPRHRVSEPQPVQVEIPTAQVRLQPLGEWRERGPDDHQVQALRLNADAVRRAEKGDYDPAVAELRQALQLVPDHPVIRQNLQTVMLNAALRDLEGGRPLVARDRLREAVGYGERGDLRQALGLANLQAGDPSAARADLERAVEKGAADPGLWLALGETYLRQNDRPHALEMLQRARDAGATSPQLDALLKRLGREVDAEWDFAAIESPHFRVTFDDGKGSSAARFVLDGLEDARSDIGRRFAYPPDGRTEVVLYAARDFHAITQTPVWAGGAYDGRIKVPVGGLQPEDPALPRLLRHEYMHSVVGQLSGNHCPTWLNEGLAVWAEEGRDGERRAWAEGAVHDARLFHLNEIAGPLIGLPSSEALVAYAQSYLAVRELIDRYGARRLAQLVEDLRKQPLAVAFADVYPDTLADFEERWLRALGS